MEKGKEEGEGGGEEEEKRKEGGKERGEGERARQEGKVRGEKETRGKKEKGKKEKRGRRMKKGDIIKKKRRRRGKGKEGKKGGAGGEGERGAEAPGRRDAVRGARAGPAPHLVVLVGGDGDEGGLREDVGAEGGVLGAEAVVLVRFHDVQPGLVFVHGVQDDLGSRREHPVGMEGTQHGAHTPPTPLPRKGKGRGGRGGEEPLPQNLHPLM